MFEKKTREQAYISLGSNYADAPARLRHALEAITVLDGVEARAISPLFITEPQDYRAQDWFYNQCVKVELEKSWTPENFLKKLLELETVLGRVREKAIRFGPRAIDLDLLLFGQRQEGKPSCMLPHPRMHRRAFVLLPLYLIEPSLLLYGQGLDFWLSRLNWKVCGYKIWQDQ